MGNKSSMLRSTPRADDFGATSRVAAGDLTALESVANMQHELSPSNSMAKMLTVNIASIRPAECSPRSLTPLDQKIMNALKQRWQRSQHDRGKDNQLTRIILKFPLAAEAFDSARTTFQAFDMNNKGYIKSNDLSKVFEHLGASFSTEEIGQLSHKADMSEHSRLNFNEFLVYLAIGFVLHKIPSLEEDKEQLQSQSSSNQTSSQMIVFEEGRKLRLAFQLAVEAFLWFDVDGNGVVNRSNMSTKLQSSMALHSPTKKMSSRDLNKDMSDDSSNQAIWEQRFREMDWNGNGTIHFKEFFRAFESWVGLEE